MHNLLASTNVKFDVIGITASKVHWNKKHVAIIDLPSYSIKHYLERKTTFVYKRRSYL